MIINHNCCIKLVPLVTFTSYASEHYWGQSGKSSVNDLLKIPTVLHVAHLFEANKKSTLARH